MVVLSQEHHARNGAHDSAFGIRTALSLIFGPGESPYHTEGAEGRIAWEPFAQSRTLPMTEGLLDYGYAFKRDFVVPWPIILNIL